MFTKLLHQVEGKIASIKKVAKKDDRSDVEKAVDRYNMMYRPAFPYSRHSFRGVPGIEADRLDGGTITGQFRTGVLTDQFAQNAPFHVPITGNI